MITYILVIVAVLLCWVAEAIRIKVMHGKVVNVSKRITRIIAYCLFIPVVFIGKPWLFGFWACASLVGMYVGCRGTLYDPLLNIFPLKRKWWQDSETTNSNGDRFERELKIRTYQQRALYLGLWLVCIGIYELSKKI